MNAESQECPNCGRTYWDDLHVELCRESPFSGVETCPMGGDDLGSADLNHLARCDGG